MLQQLPACSIKNMYVVTKFQIVYVKFLPTNMLDGRNNYLIQLN